VNWVQYSVVSVEKEHYITRALLL